MVFNNKKQGQAAIEFLMTYGWMLLVVLIVGALIFSFVDFGALLPKKVDLGNNLKGDGEGSLAYAFDSSLTDKQDEVDIVFTYIGSTQARINYTAGRITTDLGENCYSYRIENVDTGEINGCDANSVDCDKATADAAQGTAAATFINGQTGIMTFICSQAGSGTPASIVEDGTYAGTNTPDLVRGLIDGDVLEGNIEIRVTNPRTNLDVISQGDIRITIDS